MRTQLIAKVGAALLLATSVALAGASALDVSAEPLAQRTVTATVAARTTVAPTRATATNTTAPTRANATNTTVPTRAATQSAATAPVITGGCAANLATTLLKDVKTALDATPPARTPARVSTQAATRTVTRAGTVAPTAVTRAATGVCYVAVMIGEAEVPTAGDRDGYGVAAISIDTRTQTVVFDVAVDDIRLPASGLHIHTGAAGKAGAIVVDSKAAPNAQGVALAVIEKVDAALITKIVTNPDEYYVNVHNSEFPSGAVRGQLQLRSDAKALVAEALDAVQAAATQAPTRAATRAANTNTAVRATTAAPTTAAGRTNTVAPTTAAARTNTPVGTGTRAASTRKLNINKATRAELIELPGIGEVLADRIIEYRTKNGNFKTLADLEKVDGIGPETANDLKDLISFE